MKTLSSILIICFLFIIIPTSSEALDCPRKYGTTTKGELKYGISYRWQALNSTEKRICEKRIKKLCNKNPNYDFKHCPELKTFFEKRQNPFALFGILLLIVFPIYALVQLFKYFNKPKQEEKSKVNWFIENFKDPSSLKVKAPNEKKQQEEKTEIKKEEPKKEKPKEKLSWNESPKVEEKKVQSKKGKTKVKNWFFENFKDPTTLKVNASNEKNKQETKKVEPQEIKPKKILTWDEPAKPEPKKEEPVKEEPKPAEVTITSQEEEFLTSASKRLFDDRSPN